MSSGSKLLVTLFFTVSAASGVPASAADFSCNGLVPIGNTMICPGYEPNWAVKLSCTEEGMSSAFVDAFSGADIVETPGRVAIHSENPWGIDTEHGLTGLIAYTPDGCLDASDRSFDFTFTANSVPGYSGQVAPICCRIESTPLPSPEPSSDDS